MSSINLIGNLLDPNGLFSVGDKVKFTHQTTTGETIKSAVSIIIIPPDGSYNLNLQYGLIKVEYRDVLTGVYKTVGVVTVNGDSVATTLPQLLSAITPPTPPPGAVTEAPVNGKTYGRMDAGWIEIISGSSGVEEAPIDGNRYSRSDESWVVPKMQDATDAELNIVVGIIPEQGLQWDYGSSSDSGKWFSSSPSNTGNGIKANPEDKNGVVTNLMELDGYIVDILTDDMGDFLNVTLEAIDILGVYTLLRFNGIPSVFASGSITILDAGVPVKEPLQDGDAWVYNGSESKFKPTPTVPTVVVTEFPASPDANTLYIKVV